MKPGHEKNEEEVATGTSVAAAQFTGVSGEIGGSYL
jgi:hypothetical protein